MKDTKIDKQLHLPKHFIEKPPLSLDFITSIKELIEYVISNAHEKRTNQIQFEFIW